MLSDVLGYSVQGFLDADLLLLGWLIAMEYEEMVVSGGLISIFIFLDS